MAIKIPSKHIYDMDNPKIRDNFIDNVKVDMTVVKPNNEYDKSVFNEKIYSLTFVDKSVSNENKIFHYLPSDTGNIVDASYVKVYNQKIVYKNIYIPVLQKNTYIEKINTGVDENNDEKIKISLYGNLEKGTASANCEVVKDGFNDNLVIGEIVTNKTSDLQSYYDIPKKIEYINATTNELEVANVGNIPTVTYTTVYLDNVEYYLFNLEIFCSLKIVKMYSNLEIDNIVEMAGEYEHFVPNQVEITFYGNTIGISLEDGTITYGVGNKPHSIDGNELLQDSTTTYGVPTTDYLAGTILTRYENGRETATLLCDIGEYFDESGEKIIGIEMQDRMSFHTHDLVIPYVYGADGKDRPMSRYSDGQPKVFEVVAVRKFFDGAIWQELSLLELHKVIE